MSCCSRMGSPNSGPSGALGRSPDVMGHNSVPLFEDKEKTLGLGSFSSFVICALNDQSQPGRGQTQILPGAHLVAEKFFRWQREVGDGKMAIEGPGWPRLYHNCPNRCGLNYMPDMIRNACVLDCAHDASRCVLFSHRRCLSCCSFIDETSETTPDGRRWPRPTPVLMEEGDAAFTVFHCPHTASRNAVGTESRKNVRNPRPSNFSRASTRRIPSGTALQLLMQPRLRLASLSC